MNKLMAKILVHTCYSIEQGTPKPALCACRKLVSKRAADILVSGKLAEWVMMYDRKTPYHSGKQICMVHRAKSTPRAATIEKAHIERAYVTGGVLYAVEALLGRARFMLSDRNKDLEEQKRIEMYGEMQKEFFSSLTSLYDNDEWVATEKKYRGRSLSIADGGDMLRPIKEQK